MITKVDIQQIKRNLIACDLKRLFFEELGWNRLKGSTLSIPYKGLDYIFEPLAEKGGFKVYTCTFTNGPIAEDKVLKQLDRLLEPYAHEKIVIFLDASQTNQVWLWVKREAGKPAAPRINKLYQGQSAELLSQKLAKIAFGIEEEDSVDVIGTYGRIKSGFDVDKVTTKFYERFKKEHTSFLGHIQGIPDDEEHKEDREWYASLMLNRLMFVYFIQKKGLLDNTSKHQLDGDKDYLQKRMQLTQSLKGSDVFYTFYRYFLRRLFHDGLNKPERDREPELEQLIGNIPYINGGLFDVHMLEQKYTDIQIVDEAFEKLFSFFEDFDWYLDDRPARKGNEINPDVLGYIFEKYINQKQMGAYYTKEDITEYISKNTIIPFLFEKAAEQCPIAFTPDGPVWSLLRDNPDDYIYEAVSRGANEPLPAEIEAGVHDISQRTLWNKVAPDTHALPTEIWREVVARRQRYEDVRMKMVAGEITSINDLITYNLDISRFAQDVITYCEGTDLLQAFYNAIEKVTVLDPTCGSGAFLFAALNILKPLYEACLKRMRVLVTERDSLDAALPASQRKIYNRIDRFRTILARVEQHPSQEYFVLKSIVINNLYGVDIMEEAVEICKLRLFLKLVAQIQKPDELEPLPDIDFNVMAGNTLIGYTNLEDVRRIIGQNVFAGSELGASLVSIEEQAKEIERSEKHFRILQTDYKIESLQEHKQLLRSKLKKLRADLNPYLAYEYGIDHNNMPQEDNYKKSYEKWLKTHQPFHWWIEFYEIMNNGGFDVIIGNPPYVEYRIAHASYKVLADQYVSQSSKNLYAFCMERSTKLLYPNGRFGMIVPSGLLGLDEAIDLRKALLKHFCTNWFSTFAIRPAKLFEGVDQRLCIHIASVQGTSNALYTTTYHHWYMEERPVLFALAHYCTSDIYPLLNRIPQVGDLEAAGVLEKLKTVQGISLRNYYAPHHAGFLMHYHRSPRYWIRGMDFEQYFKSDVRSRSIHHFRDLYFKEEAQGKSIGAILNSSLFFFWFILIGNGRNITGTDVELFPIGSLSETICKHLVVLFDGLMDDYKHHSIIRVRRDCEFQEFRPSQSKAIIDEIDRVLARHYGFTDQEQDFIINYNIKYRMGRDSGEEGEE